MLDPYTNAGGASFKRSNPPTPPLYVPTGHVAFRLLCHASRIGGVIGKSGAIIKQLQQDTSARIRVEESPPSSGDRVIVITASNSINRKIVLDEEEYEVSAAQETVVKVFERILDVAAETDGVSVAAGGLVSCRLLAEPSHAGSVIGKGVTATPEELGFEESIEFIKQEGNEEEATKPRRVERKRIDRVEDKESVE